MPSEALTRAVHADDAPAASNLPAPIVALNSPAMLQQITESLPSHMDPVTFQRHALTLVKQNPKLLECEATSVAQGIVRGAALGLDPDPALGQMWLVPRNTKIIEGGRERWASVATFQIGYKGLYELVMRTGKLAKVDVVEVHRNDEFEARLGSDGGLHHRPDWWGDRGPVVGWYAYAKLKDGTEQFRILSVAEAEEHRDRFGPKKRDGQVYGPWVDHFGAQSEKTVFIKLAKWLPKSVELLHALEVDGQAVLAPIGAEVRPQDVIEATHQPEPERPGLAPVVDVEDEPDDRVEVSDDARAADREAGERDLAAASPALADENGEPIEASGGEAESAPEISDEVRTHQKKLFATVKELWGADGDAITEARRHGLIGCITNGRTESSNELTDSEWRDIWDAIDLIKLGSLDLHRKATGEFILRDVPARRRAPAVPKSGG